MARAANQDLVLFGSDHCAFNYKEQKELGKDDFTLIPNGAPTGEERAMVLWTHGVREGRISENLFVALLATNQARVHGMRHRKGFIAAGMDADVVVWDPDLEDHRDAGESPRQRGLHAVRGHVVHRRPGVRR